VRFLWLRFEPEILGQTTRFGFDPSPGVRLGASLDVGPGVALRAHRCQYTEAHGSHRMLARLSHNWDNRPWQVDTLNGKNRSFAAPETSSRISGSLMVPSVRPSQAPSGLCSESDREARKLSQADAASVLGVTQPKVSALRHYKLSGFSVERLMNLLTALDHDVEIVIRRKPHSRKAARINVVAA
jgi:hypothetical protein